MATMRPAGMGMRGERGGRSIGAKDGPGASDASKKKVNFRKIWPTIWTLV